MLNRKRWAINSLLFALLLPILPSCLEKPERPEPPRIFGNEPFLSIISSDNYQDVLSEWMRRGYRNMTVVHVGTKDGMAFIPEARIKAIKALHEIKQTAAGGGPLVTADNYLFAAARLGLIKRVFWIIPYSHLAYINAEVRVQEFLDKEASLFRKRDIASMKFNNGCVSGVLWDIETYICSPTTLPSLEMPVLMTLETGFFPPYAAQRQLSKLSVMKEFFDNMALRKIRTTTFHILSLPGLAARQEYLREEIVAVLKEPVLLQKEAPPSLWMLRDQADNMLTGGGIREASELLESRINEYPDDPYLMIMQQTARALLSEKGMALRALERLCPKQAVYCRAMADIGVALQEEDGLDGAELFLEKALALRPDSDMVRLEWARTLYNRKQCQKASDLLVPVKESVYEISALFLLGDCSHARKDENEALQHYQKALKLYQEAGAYRLGSREQESLNRLKAIYEKRNDKKGLEALSRSLITE